MLLRTERIVAKECIEESDMQVAGIDTGSQIEVGKKSEYYTSRFYSFSRDTYFTHIFSHNCQYHGGEKQILKAQE